MKSPSAARGRFTTRTRAAPCLLLRPAEQTLSWRSARNVPTWDVPSRRTRKAGRLRCPCHQGLFDAATGRPVAGPARRPLPRIVLENRDGVLYAVGVEDQGVIRGLPYRATSHASWAVCGRRRGHYRTAAKSATYFILFVIAS